MNISEVTRRHRWETKVNRPAPDGCWEWTAQRTGNGYGMFMWEWNPLTHTRTMTTAHRAAYRLHVDDTIPEGWEIDHLCRNRGCVNPAHLRAVSVAENRASRDVARGDRTVNGRKTHCAHGHELSGANLRVNRNGSRACRECGRLAMRRYRDARR